jgi:hypothetical protein
MFRVPTYLGLVLAVSTTLSASEMCIKVLDETGLPLPRAQGSDLKSIDREIVAETNRFPRECLLPEDTGSSLLR